MRLASILPGALLKHGAALLACPKAANHVVSRPLLRFGGTFDAQRFRDLTRLTPSWTDDERCGDCRQGEPHALFPVRHRHQPRRPPPAKIRPGSPAPTRGPGTVEGDVPSSPAPTMGPGTVEGDVPMVRLSSAKNPNCVVPPSGNPNAIDEIRESLVTPKKPVCG
jgi:hypothetical protein